ncbi:Acyl-CoA synthetase (AMP-forming)/AMP-acid ligase II [Mycolicibacterium neoaurum]|uniref:AMP-binding protein n=1 Tax=Mycolicibacterium neoaurum TaxID=1795 RepID=UPI00068A714A|nr:AMP-binding protein [Mycolicibacterium neoaurum]SDE22237.1 Acyl-CoA synthetase (AMP-forming)/AMP-acid ligase II [Mycolicibacterium neoaurum]
MPTIGRPDTLESRQTSSPAADLSDQTPSVVSATPRRGGLSIDIAAVMTSSAATGVLGFVFWTVAARGYDTAEVGRASAIITSATLIAILANFSLGSLYERFLPLAGHRTKSIVRQGMMFVAATALVFGAAFTVLGPRAQLFPDPVDLLFFPLFVVILAIYALQDQILIGLGRARAIATKNISQSIAKLVIVAGMIPLATGSAIVWSWVLPAAVITGIIAIVVIRRETSARTGTADLPDRRELVNFFASSYAINAINVIVPLLVPLIVVAQLGTEMNAYFSMCWLVVNTLGALIVATAAPFIATASTPGADVWACTKRFVLLCGGSAVTGCVVLMAAAPFILGILGPHYAANGTTLIRTMALVLPAVALTTIYTALARLQRKLRLAVISQVLLGVLVVVGVILTTPEWGIDAVGYTYVAGELLITLIVLGPTVALLRRVAATPSGQALDSPVRTTPIRPDLSHIAPIEFDSVSERFGQIAQDKRDSVAVRTANASITYGELKSAAETWTHALRRRHDPEAPVAMVADLSPQIAAVVLGSFAAGAPLVPLDPGLPQDRIIHIFDALREHGCRVDTVIVDDPDHAPARQLADGCTVWPAHIPPERAPAPGPSAALDRQRVTSIQFTSGSSGEPKAVLHVHGTWLSDWILHRDRFGIVGDSRVALCMPVSFAAGMNVLVGALLSGAQVVAIDPRNCTPESAIDRLADADIVMCTPSFLQSLTEAASGRTLFGVQRIVTTGEPVYGNVLRRARELAPNAVLTNWAGSSETLGIAHFDIWPDEEVPAGVIPAGVAVPHKELGIDELGRLTVTSPYVAAGYLRADSASTTFTTNPDGSRTFVTNDRARITEDGTLVVLGRMDAAVKIRGYLVEPAEVEAALLDCPGVREALVVADQHSGAPVLTAYVAPDPELRSPAVADIRAQLHTRLPAWMVPTNVVMLQELPRNDRGKVDRRALPAPTRGPITAPEDGLESAIATAWAEVLRLDQIGRDENFYALGGDSLNVQRMISLVGGEHDIRLTASDLAAAPTIAQFAEVVRSRRAGEAVLRDSGIRPTTVVLRTPGEHTRSTLFCFAGAGASALSFVPLTDRLGVDTAVIAFQAQGLENRAFPDWTIGRAARRHLSDLLSLQPTGPYRLAGHSLGAFIAIDVANRLRALGHQVELVTLLDPFLPPRTVRAARRELPDVGSTLLEQPPAAPRELWRQRLWLPLAGILDGTPDEKVAALREVGVRVGRLHRPRPYPGRTLLILSSFNRDDERVWPQLLAGDLSVQRINCDHDSVVREPHVGRVAEMIRAQR